MPLRIGAPLTIGVLALQGDVREHLHVLRAAGAQAVPVRRPDELGGVDGLVLPGGESTTIVKLARTFDLLEPLRKRISDGLPVFGSCAGMILLADRLVGGPEGQETFGGIDVTVRRNAFGRQVDSFEADLAVDGLEGGPLHAVFIRAPWVESVGPAATPLATVTAGPAAGKVVVVRQGQLLATSFHPELTGDGRMHAYFCDMVGDSGR
jgi:pyridoxal 5'-phosphate synthase pdxT subunit